VLIGGNSLIDMPRRKKHDRRRGSTRPKPMPPGMQRLSPPKTRLKSLLQLLVEIPAAAEQAMITATMPEDETGKRLLMFDASVLVRASNALKVIRLLCEQAHWEFAAASVRQLFELVLNTEYLATQPDREAAIFRYSKYGLLQTVRHQHLAVLYDQKTGRPIDEQRLARLESMLEADVPGVPLRG
jgi:hypothetical protein